MTQSKLKVFWDNLHWYGSEYVEVTHMLLWSRWDCESFTVYPEGSAQVWAVCGLLNGKAFPEPRRKTCRICDFMCGRANDQWDSLARYDLPLLEERQHLVRLVRLLEIVYSERVFGIL